MVTTANEPEKLAKRAIGDSSRETRHCHVIRIDDEPIVEIGNHPNRHALPRHLGVVGTREP